MNGLESTQNMMAQINLFNTQVKSVEEKYAQKQDISLDVESLIPFLNKFNDDTEVLYTISQNIGMQKSIQHLLSSLNFIKFVATDKTIQEKVNALQVAILPPEPYVGEFKNKNWKIGEKVEKSNESKQS